jgi:hypothetical protein
MRGLLAALLAVASPVVPASRADGPSEGLVTDPLPLGPGQVARLRVYGLAPRFGSVDLRLLLKDPAGATLASKEVTLHSGQTVKLELPRSAVSSSGARVPVRGEVEWLTTATGGPCPKLRATLEIYEAASGRIVRRVTAGPACPVRSEPAPPHWPQ